MPTPPPNHAELVVHHRGEVGVERPREVRSVVEEPDERLRRHADRATPGVVDAPVDVALEMAGLTREAAERPLRAVPRRHERREEERLADALLGAAQSRGVRIRYRYDTSLRAVVED